MSIPVHGGEPRVAVPCRCTLGEEVTWDARSDHLIWVDIEDPAVWRHHPGRSETERFAVGEKISFALLTSDPDVVLAGFTSGVERLRLSDGHREPLVKPEPHPPGNRLNSGQVGPDGALYFGTMDDGESGTTGGFFRWDGSDLRSFGGQAAVTNGPVLSPDGATAYTADTANGVVRSHVIRDGFSGEPRPLIVFPRNWGKPDGLTVDAEGHLWVCHYGGARVTRFTPEGAPELVVPMPTDLVTKCAFGGADLTDLYVTTALRARDPATDPVAGHLFVVETAVRGLAAQVFGSREGLIEAGE
ncbi:SMP-30/gluconolactonase/LRE family protein [Methylobacterium iners]|uniref:L-arabinolactonase n=1 Tax=Methylobacterium iners TaxID=418707 RepID=A0ABQ4RXS1_9HYPH|nr:SMP-30/gluconolactonase/LRE family protein [Methylobacterium iners]GJD94993.1 L-arabinolactonase [Methylobacterium iners]